MHLSRATLISFVAGVLAAAAIIATPVAGARNGSGAPEAGSPPKNAYNYSLFAVSFTSSSVGWAAGTQATIIRTSDGGRHWVSQAKSLPPDRGSFTSVSAVSSKVCWAVGTFGIFKTVDGGKTWAQAAKKLRPTALTMNTWQSVATAGNKVVWLASSLGDVAKSVNAGKTWTWQHRARPGIDAFGAIACNGSKHAWIPVDSVSTVYGRSVLTTADGSQWSAVQSDLWYYGLAELEAVCSSSTTMVWLGRGDGSVYLSVDGGRSWQLNASEIVPGLFGLGAMDCVGQTVCAVGGGASNGAAAMANGGLGWAPATIVTKGGAFAFGLFDVDLLTAKVGWAVGAGGQVFKTVDAGATWRQLR